jgi:hypothetical protein
MMKKQTRKKVTAPTVKKTLFKVGHHLIDVDDVLTISCVRKNLYIIKMKSNPDPEFPIWVNGAEVSPLLKKFNIENADGTDKYSRGEDRRPHAFDCDGMNPDDDDTGHPGHPSNFG